jgi:alkylated DNA repair dioxygenase AlkB
MMQEPKVTIYSNYLMSEEATALYVRLCAEIPWDERMKARKTACFGQTYDDSGVDYEVQPMHPLLEPICQRLVQTLGFLPTNCLLNYYETGQAKMGFHSDVTYNLAAGTGIAILSLGTDRALSFRAKDDHTQRFHHILSHGSLLYMSQETQDDWEHAIKPSKTELGRISLTFHHILMAS